MVPARQTLDRVEAIVVGQNKSGMTPVAVTPLLLITGPRWSLGLDDAWRKEDEQFLFPNRFRLVFE